ncbi:MAG: fibrobacter succinogenes major paralogous domain-containing protein, partial [archaeon]
MAENLNYKLRWLADKGSDWCYNNNESNCDTYGRLYDWKAVMHGESSSNINPSGVQGVCPDGWHVPSDKEWKELEMELGMSQSEADNTGWRGTNEGSKLAGNASLWNDGDLENNSEFGTSGFTALPGGGCNIGGSFCYFRNYGGWWWSSTENSSTDAWYRSLNYTKSKLARDSPDEEFGFSVRCVRDD